jgi:hypothetical protein
MSVPETARLPTIIQWPDAKAGVAKESIWTARTKQLLGSGTLRQPKQPLEGRPPERFPDFEHHPQSLAGLDRSK